MHRPQQDLLADGLPQTGRWWRGGEATRLRARTRIFGEIGEETFYIVFRIAIA
jgi:hypothetical protein